MARKRKEDDKPKLADIRVSVRINPADHKRLKALALATDRTENKVILDALAPHLATVRVPWVVGRGAEAPGPEAAGGSENAA